MCKLVLSKKFVYFGPHKMTGLNFYYDLMSQPSRAVFLFLKATNIPFISHKVLFRKGVYFHFSLRYLAYTISRVLTDRFTVELVN